MEKYRGVYIMLIFSLFWKNVFQKLSSVSEPETK